MNVTLRAGRVVAAGGTWRPGWVEVAEGRIVAAGPGDPPVATAVDLGDDGVVVPGYVDIHVHGGGGFDLTGGDPGQLAGAVEFHRHHGTTTMLASMVTAPVDALAAAMRSIVVWLDGAEGVGRSARAGLVGVHLEGPFLAESRCGAQNPAHMVDPDPAAVDALLAAGGRYLKVVTMAPERPGAIVAVERFTAAGVTVAIGHTDATAEQADAAIAAGARLATHLGNAMPALHQRAPGPVGACLGSPDVACELIVDMHHLHPGFVRLAGRAKGRDGVVLITDAIAAAGSPDGRYQLGGLDVDVAGGVARLTHGGSLAGSTLTMDAAVANAVGCGWTLEQAVAAAATNPARLLGLAGEAGAIEAGLRADLVVLDADLTVRAVIAAGDLVSGAL